MLSKKKLKKQVADYADDTMVYCGPTLPGIVKQYTVYKGGVPPQLAAALQADPVLRNLLVPADCLPEVRRQLRECSGYYYSLFSVAAGAARKGRM